MQELDASVDCLPRGFEAARGAPATALSMLQRAKAAMESSGMHGQTRQWACIESAILMVNLLQTQQNKTALRYRGDQVWVCLRKPDGQYPDAKEN